jgi:hypothetical protein
MKQQTPNKDPVSNEFSKILEIINLDVEPRRASQIYAIYKKMKELYRALLLIQMSSPSPLSFLSSPVLIIRLTSAGTLIRPVTLARGGIFSTGL